MKEARADYNQQTSSVKQQQLLARIAAFTHDPKTKNACKAAAEREEEKSD
jgi:hypothetical protein